MCVTKFLRNMEEIACPLYYQARAFFLDCLFGKRSVSLVHAGTVEPPEQLAHVIEKTRNTERRQRGGSFQAVESTCGKN